jgi:hypothetical protein
MLLTKVYVKYILCEESHWNLEAPLVEPLEKEGKEIFSGIALRIRTSGMKKRMTLVQVFDCRIDSLKIER